MSIDTGLSISFNENYPVAGADQPSQGMRDNFKITKVAIEKLQNTSSTAGSLLSLSTSVSQSGDIFATIGLNNNTLLLPQGTPTTALVSGMIRFYGGVLQIHNGSAWLTHVAADASGIVSLPGPAMVLPQGNTAQRPPQPQDGMIRWNTETHAFELYGNFGWSQVVTTGGSGNLTLNNLTVHNTVTFEQNANSPLDGVNLQSLRLFAANMFAGSKAGLTATYNDVNNSIDYAVLNPTLTFTGSATGSGTITALSNTSFNLSQAANSVILNVHSNSAYVSAVTAGTGITVSGSGGNNAAVTIGVATNVELNTNKNAVNGYAGLDGTGRVSSTLLPAFAGDVTSTGGLANLTLSNSGVVAGTYSKVAVDLKGRVTSGGSIISSDITSALGYTPVNRVGDTITGSLKLSVASGRQQNWNDWLDASASSGGASLIGQNLFLNYSDGTLVTPNAHSTIGYSALRFAFGAAQVAKFVGATTANVTVTPTFYDIITAGGGQIISTSLQVGVTSQGSLTLRDGSGTNTGYVGFLNSSGTRIGYVGNADGSSVYVAAEGGRGVVINGSTTTVNAPTSISAANGTSGSNFLTLTPTNVAAIRPQMYFNKTTTAKTWEIGLDDGAGTPVSGSAINIQAGSLTLNGVTVLTSVTATGDATGTTSAGSIALTLAASGVTAGTYTKLTVDAKGRATVGASLSSGDITTALGYTPVNKAGDTVSGTLAVTGTLSSAYTNFTGNSAPSVNNTYNLGNATNVFANVYSTLFRGTATSAQYADVAERYHADAEYLPGTVVVFGGEKEITVTNSHADTRLAGIVSTQPAFMMNRDAGDDTTHPYIALVGRAPCLVVGRIKKGDLLTTSNTVGHACSTSTPVMGAIVGKALQDHDEDGTGVIEISVHRS